MDEREVTRSLDPWLETEIGRFHQRLSLVLVGLSGLIVTVALIRNHDDADGRHLSSGQGCWRWRWPPCGACWCWVRSPRPPQPVPFVAERDRRCG
jgi:hypothetical protein